VTNNHRPSAACSLGLPILFNCNLSQPAVPLPHVCLRPRIVHLLYRHVVLTCCVYRLLYFCAGVVTADEIEARYDFNWHPEVRAGKKTVKEAAREFMNQWDRQNKDGLVSPEEFEDYYKDVSAGIDDDDYFELMMRNAWRIAGGTGAAANTANKRVLVTNRDGTQAVQTIENELGMRPGDREEARRRLAQQGIDAADVGMHAGVDNRGKARNAGGNPLARSSGAAVGGARGRDSGNNIFPTQQPAPRQSTPVARGRTDRDRHSGGGGGRAAPREAWGEGPSRGDESFAPEEPEPPRRGTPRQQYAPATQPSPRGPSAGAGGASRSSGFDAFDTLKRLLYNPPIPIEPLCAKLAVSSVSQYPRIAMGAFLSR
jgi:hypothetical protein